MNNSLQINRIGRSLLAFSCFAVIAYAQNTPQNLGIFETGGDVGETPLKGKVEFNAGTGEYRVTGGGANIWAGTDAFYFVSKKISGDVALTADIRFEGTGAVAHRKAALMIRQSLDAGAAYADAALHGDGLTSLQFRPSSGAITQEIRSDLKAPVRIRIERRGNVFTMFAGAPGEELKPTGPATVTLQDPVYAGLAVCSHDANVLETAVFTNVKLESLTPARPRFGSKISIFDLRDRSTKIVYETNETFEAPNWSLDGKYLLSNSRGKLFRIPVEGPATPEPLDLDPSLRCNNDHGFSPDGKRIAISASSPSSRQSQVYIASADGSSPRLMAAATPSYFHGWSPDGRFLAFIGQRNGNFDIFRVPVTGGAEERLTSSPGYDDGADYSPDGKWIYFNSNRSGSWDIWRIPADGAGPNDERAQQVTNDELEDWFPHPSPDGKQLLFLSFPKGTTGHNDKLEVQLRMTPMPGAKLTPPWITTLAKFFGGQGTINVNSWAPDSTRFAFVVYEPLAAAASQVGDPAGAKYSALKQIDRSNVNRLQVAWTFHTGDVSDGTAQAPRSAFETTPLVVDGVMYITTPFSRLIALDAETGKQLWAFDPKIDRDRPYNLFINRGAAFWSDGSQSRILLGTLDGKLFSIDAKSGQPDDSFGKAGWIGLREGAADKFPNRGYGMTSPPVVYQNLVVCGSLTADGDPKGPSGDVRAFDIHTGKIAWTFHTVPHAGEFGNDTWEGDSWKDRAAVNAWSRLSVDLERGILFLPLTSPAFDFYGGDRKGAGLFGDSLVALDAATGKRLWHFQTVHHNLWDYDIPAQPNLVTVRRDGKDIAAVAQITKTGFTFIFDRVTGKPLYDIEEAPVPKSEVPGEEAWPTQPKPVAPPPYARQGMRPDELTDVTLESRAYCAKLLEGAVFGNIFTPIGLKPTLLFPGTNGGANWGGASFDPETRTLYVNSMDAGMLYHLVKRPGAVPYRPQGPGTQSSRFWDPNLWPCQKPPWGFLTAIDLDHGTFRWRSVLGVVDALAAKGLPPTGTPNLGGSLVTAGGLVFIGATYDSRFRAFDKETGRELWVTRLPASAHATPVTFEGVKSKKQYVVIAAGGGNKYGDTFSDALVAYALP